MTWADFVRLAFEEIRQAGAGAPQVARRLQFALQDIRTVCPPERRAVLEEQLELLSASTTDAFGPRDAATALQPDPSGIGVAPNPRQPTRGGQHPKRKR